MKRVKKIAAGAVITTMLFGWTTAYAAEYTVQAGDSLWIISNKFGTTISEIKQTNGLSSDMIYVGQKLTIPEAEIISYKVQPGDSLWIISNKFGTTIDSIKKLNGLTSDYLLAGQILKIRTSSQNTTYIIQPGDTLWILSYRFHTTIQAIKDTNHLTSDVLYVGQTLIIPNAATSTTTAPLPKPVYNWPSITYIVQPGDTAQSMARKFGVSASDIMKYNYMDAADWFDAGDKIAISGYAPRVYTVTPGEAQSPARLGKLVDWFLEGQYLLKRWDVFTLVDVDTGVQIKVRMMGGYNHSDVEPMTAQDTSNLKKLFNGSWTWSPRAVVVFKDGMNIAASLSGMPHSESTITDNNVQGHFDLYLQNSKPHSETTSSSYVQQHQEMVLKAAGK